MRHDDEVLLKRVTQPRDGDKNDGADFVDESQYFDGVAKMADEIVAEPVDLPDDRPAFHAPAISPEELDRARIAPPCIVSNMFYADVGLLIAPGGSGKTTLMLFVAAHVVLGRDLFGETVETPGNVLFVTAEDSREILVARLRAVMDAMRLDDAERKCVIGGIHIADVSGSGFRLTLVADDVVIPSGNVNEIVAACADIRPVMIALDPAVSFGVGESRVNDAEQGLIETGRRLRNALACCVIFIHHSGKMNAREKTLDQYSGRGGSAFADGSRMVHVLQNLTAYEWQQATGETLADGETGLILARPKMSYCPPVAALYVRRRGYSFQRVEPLSTSKTARVEGDANQLHQLLIHELGQGRYHTKNSIEHADAGSMSRAQIRTALAFLEASEMVETRTRSSTGRGGARQYLHPFGSPRSGGEAK